MVSALDKLKQVPTSCQRFIGHKQCNPIFEIFVNSLGSFNIRANLVFRKYLHILWPLFCNWTILQWRKWPNIGYLIRSHWPSEVSLTIAYPHPHALSFVRNFYRFSTTRINLTKILLHLIVKCYFKS